MNRLTLFKIGGTFVLWMICLGIGMAGVGTALGYISAGISIGFAISFFIMSAMMLGLAIIGTLFIWAKSDFAEPKEEKIMLHRHDLSKWNYLGYGDIKDSKEITALTAHFFSSKTDTKRSFHIICNQDYLKRTYKTLSYYHKYILPWSTGEYRLYELVTGNPSHWLTNFMLTEHNCIWDKEAKWWVKSKTKSIPPVPPKSKVTKSEDNIVTVDFKKT